MQRSGTSFTSIFLSVLLHLGAAALLLISINMNSHTFRPAATEVVQAVTVDSKEVDKELQKLQDIDKQKQEKQRAAEQKLREAEQKLANAEKQRKQEEVRLAEASKQREQEQKKQEQLKKQQDELEQKKQREDEKKRTAETERIKKEKDAAKAAETERVRKEQEAAQAQQDQQFLSTFGAEIKRRVINNFNISGLPTGLKCVISVRVIPGGEIVNVSINRSSGNDIFDQRALVAVQKSAPLPVPADAATLDRLKLRQFSFEFSP